MACERAVSDAKTQPAIVNEQIRARANEAFMNSLPCYPTFQMAKDGPNDRGHLMRWASILAAVSFAQLLTKGHVAASETLGYIAASASTRYCGAPASSFGSIVR